MAFRNFSLAFKRDDKAQGVAELARTPGLAIAQVIVRTDYELEDLIEIREVFGAPKHDNFFPS